MMTQPGPGRSLTPSARAPSGTLPLAPVAGAPVRCVPYHCTLAAIACAERQAQASLSSDPTHLSHCRNCTVGKSVVAMLKESGVTVPEPVLAPFAKSVVRGGKRSRKRLWSRKTV